MKNGKRGITLIALIITIIIMLILVAVTIDLAIDGKIFNSASDAVSKSNEKVAYQEEKINGLLDEWDEINSEGEMNYCPGTGYTCTTQLCDGTSTDNCPSCSGTGFIINQCPGPSQDLDTDVDMNSCVTCDGTGYCQGTPETSDYSMVLLDCPKCGTQNSFYAGLAYCSTCKTSGDIGVCKSCNYTFNYHDDVICPSCGGQTEATGDQCMHGETEAHEVSTQCDLCEGTGNIGGTTCQHGLTEQHRYCTHYNNTTLTTHTYCEHGKTEEHYY